MDDIELLEYRDMNLSNAMVIVAFPTVGLISSIAGRYIVDSLKLEEIGAITSRQFMPATIIHNTIPSPPVRIYAGKKQCGPHDQCEQLVVIISEFMPPFDSIKPLVDTIIAWADKKGCKLLLTFEGTNKSPTTNPKTIQIFGVGSNSTMKKILDKNKIIQTQEGMITGVSGVLLYEGVLKKRDVLCLLAEAQVE
jgi:uncharacterized protein